MSDQGEAVVAKRRKPIPVLEPYHARLKEVAAKRRMGLGDLLDGIVGSWFDGEVFFCGGSCDGATATPEGERA